jgi:hypothetical protein
MKSIFHVVHGVEYLELGDAERGNISMLTWLLQSAQPA